MGQAELPSDPRAELSHALEDVEGWLFLNEAFALYSAARNAAEADSNAVIVEIGSWKGRSTIALAMGLRDGGGSGRVSAIDPHTGEPDRLAPGPPVTVAEFNNNIERAGIEHKVELMLITSHLARPRFQQASVDVLFVDGSHQYDDVLQDIQEWQSSLKPGGVVAFNDPSAPGVYRALRERVLTRGSYREPHLIENTVLFHFRPTEKWRLRDEIELRRGMAGLRLRFDAMRFRRGMPMPLVRLGRRVIYAVIGGAL